MKTGDDLLDEELKRIQHEMTRIRMSLREFYVGQKKITDFVLQVAATIEAADAFQDAVVKARLALYDEGKS